MFSEDFTELVVHPLRGIAHGLLSLALDELREATGEREVMHRLAHPYLALALFHEMKAEVGEYLLLFSTKLDNRSRVVASAVDGVSVVLRDLLGAGEGHQAISCERLK